MNRSKKGFTLMEMLIVVAIIAILIAIAIPVFSAQLDKARTAVDAANLRSARSMAVTYAMTDTDPGRARTTETDGVTYNAESGWTIPFKYNDATKTLEIGTPSKGYNQSTPANTKTITITVSLTFVPSGDWSDMPASPQNQD